MCEPSGLRPGMGGPGPPSGGGLGPEDTRLELAGGSGPEWRWASAGGSRVCHSGQ